MSRFTSVDSVAAEIRQIARPGKRSPVAIVGPPGAGKSTVAAALADALSPAAMVLPMDGFHLPQARLTELGRRERMGAPDTFEADGFLAVLARLAPAFGNSGNRVMAPGFDREIEEPVADAIDISPEFSIVIVEGNYLLLDSGGWESAAQAFDVSFFVEVEHDIRLERLIARHQRFGKSPAEARAWACGPDEDNARTIDATAARADHIIALG